MVGVADERHHPDGLVGDMHEKHVSRTGVTVIKKRRGWVAYPNLAAGVGSRDY